MLHVDTALIFKKTTLMHDCGKRFEGVDFAHASSNTDNEEIKRSSLKGGIRQKQKTRSLKKPRVNVVGFQACSKTRYADNTQKADRNRAWVPAQPSEGLHAENSIANEKIRRDGFMKPKAA